MDRSEEYIGTLTEKGQVTIPIAIRRRLGIDVRGKVVFRVVGDRVELVAPPLTLDQAFGAVKPRKEPEDFKELHALVVDERAEKSIDRMKGE